MQLWKNKQQRRGLIYGAIVAVVVGALAPAKYNPVVLLNGILNRQG